ncbi:hypothetical protein PAHAL_5G343500 [Panicum hallii]|uniref:Uncharacterized protein n=1 Tax=Panicum hallii TaxID=206008 RepID=A0A2S3HVN5_9POAL|nr:hypothetical protein PAHAL_5G343500 [Panicum hallii]
MHGTYNGTEQIRTANGEDQATKKVLLRGKCRRGLYLFLPARTNLVADKP